MPLSFKAQILQLNQDFIAEQTGSIPLPKITHERTYTVLRNGRTDGRTETGPQNPFAFYRRRVAAATHGRPARAELADEAAKQRTLAPSNEENNTMIIYLIICYVSSLKVKKCSNNKFNR